MHIKKVEIEKGKYDKIQIKNTSFKHKKNEEIKVV